MPHNAGMEEQLPKATAIPAKGQPAKDPHAEEHNGKLLFQDREPVTSSNVDSYAWDEPKNNLYIWFRYVAPGQQREDASDTTLYVYHDVNPVDVFEFKGSESQGIYVQNILKHRYKGIKVGAKGGGGPTVGTYREDLSYAQAEARKRNP